VINWVSVQRTGTESLNAYTVHEATTPSTRPVSRPRAPIPGGVAGDCAGVVVVVVVQGVWDTTGVGVGLRRRRRFKNVTFAKSLPRGRAGCGEGWESPWTYIVIYVRQLLR